MLAPDVEAACKKAGVLETYRSMSFSHQREFALLIEDAKLPETRSRRIAKAVDQLKTKKKVSSEGPKKVDHSP